jgi:glutamate-1-semialdehyde 2,1-aminomutase/spore coat polysaccharide biosynthesis protein SpsF
MKKVVAVIQARMGSTRLPGKVLMDLGGHPVLEWCVRAARAAPGVDEVWVATSKLPGDNSIVSWCEMSDIDVWRGSETDVLARFLGCAEAAGADVLLRLTGDCPFLDPEVIGTVVRLQRQTGAPFVTNVSPRTYPDGLDVQAFTYDALLTAYDLATRPVDRECVCTWIERNRSRFPSETVINPLPGMHTERWVLDTPEDYEFCKQIALRWPWDNGPPSQLDMLGILDGRPELRTINAHHPMNERHFETLAEEPIYARSYDRSQTQFEKARAVIPLAAQTFSKSHLQYPQPSPLFLSHGDGGLAYDVDGNEYVDLVSALLPNVLGYRDADVDVEIRRQLASGISFSLATELEAQLAETLCRFGKTGTDVTTAAIRLARAYTGRDRVLICGGYHGWQDWSVERNLGVPQAVRDLTTRVRYGDAEMVTNVMQSVLGTKGFAAIIVEPEADLEYLELLRSLCNSSGTVLIFDEVITGFRFDLGGAQALFGITPDLATFGKAMANGMPLSALVGRKDIMARLEPPDNIFYSGTMFGETLSLAAGIATIAKMERENVIQKLWQFGSELALYASHLIFDHGCADYIKLRGEAPFKRIWFENDQIAALFRKEMIASGTLVVGSHNVCAAHTESDMRRILKSYRHTMTVIRTALDKGDIADRLNGASVAPMVRA